MTNKEAAEKLKEILFMTGYKEALDLAIEALEDARPTKIFPFCHCGAKMKEAEK